ncbi:MAG: oligosaccharide flippase family protein [Bacilli bacterium]|nr:oligosaccharide flippase family protein [Bacilli bacterium]
MKKEKFITSTIILMIGGFLTKILGMIIKIVMTRIVGIDGIGLYMLIFPTFALFMTISQLGFPIAISKLVSEDKYNNKNIVFSIIPFSLILNIILMFIIILIAPILANDLLKDPRCYYPILAIGLVLPFDSLSSILRGYFFGKQRMIPHVVSNITEQITRLILISITIPALLNKSLVFAVSGLILVNVVSELMSSLILFLFLPKKFRIRKEDIKPDPVNIKAILNISLPTTGSRIIGSIGYFLEPIVLTFVLLKVGYSNSFIVREYGIVSGYVMPLLLLPSFFTNAISQALLPVVSRAHSNSNKKFIKRKIKQAIFFSLLVGIPATILFEMIPELPLKFIYNTTEGISYIRFLAPICLIQYIQAPLATSLDAMGKSRINMTTTIIGICIRIISLLVFSAFRIGIWGLILGISISCIYITWYNYKKLSNFLK